MQQLALDSSRCLANQQIRHASNDECIKSTRQGNDIEWHAHIGHRRHEQEWSRVQGGCGCGGSSHSNGRIGTSAGVVLIVVKRKECRWQLDSAIGIGRKLLKRKQCRFVVKCNVYHCHWIDSDIVFHHDCAIGLKCQQWFRACCRRRGRGREGPRIPTWQEYGRQNLRHLYHD